jgi:osmotically-inducible protein OsmY
MEGSGLWNGKEGFLMARMVRLAVFVLLGTVAMAAQTAPAPDNSKVNERDKSKAAVTADQQKLNASDQQITRNIRSMVVKDKALSTYAHNVKIVTQNGKVTLKGPVRTEDEKSSIESKAKSVAGDGNVTSEIEVAPSSK